MVIFCRCRRKFYSGLSLAIILAIALFNLGSNSVFANETIEGGSIRIEGNINEGLEKFFGSIPPENPFNSVSSGLSSMVPFPFSPFSQFNITFNSDNRKGFSQGENLNVKGSFDFLSNSQSEINKSIQECLNRFSNLKEEQRKKACAAPPIYEIPSFGEVGILTQIWKVDEDRQIENQKGDFLVDEFYVAESLEISEGESKDFALSWKIPEGLPNGSYYASFFINSYKRFSLLSFPVNVYSPLSRFDFSVLTDTSFDNVYLDKNNIRINQKEYSQIYPVPIVEPAQGSIGIEFSLVNNSKEDKEVTLSYELFRWTQEDPRNILETEEKKVKIPANNHKNETYKLAVDQLESLYDLRITVVDNGVKSMANIHFSLKGGNRGMFTYLGMGKENGFIRPIFCLRNAQWEGFFEGKVKVTVKKTNGKKLNSGEIEGILEPQDGRCFVLDDSRFRRKAETSLILLGEIFDKNGNKVDQIEILYNSKDKLKVTEFNKNWMKFLLLSLIFLPIALFSLIFINKKINRKKNVKKNNKN